MNPARQVRVGELSPAKSDGGMNVIDNSRKKKKSATYARFGLPATLPQREAW